MSFRNDMRDGMALWVRVLLGVIAAIVLFGIVWLIAVFVFGFGQNVTADFTGGVQQRQLTNGNGQYRIAQYDDFHTRCQRLIAAQEQIDSDADPANSAGLPPSIAATNKAADLKDYRDEAAAYNAKASQTATAAQFKDSNLPSSVPGTYTANSGERINCG